MKYQEQLLYCAIRKARDAGAKIARPESIPDYNKENQHANLLEEDGIGGVFIPRTNTIVLPKYVSGRIVSADVTIGVLTHEFSHYKYNKDVFTEIQYGGTSLRTRIVELLRNEYLAYYIEDTLFGLSNHEELVEYSIDSAKLSYEDNETALLFIHDNGHHILNTFVTNNWKYIETWNKDILTELDLEELL